MTPRLTPERRRVMEPLAHSRRHERGAARAGPAAAERKVMMAEREKRSRSAVRITAGRGAEGN